MSEVTSEKAKGKTEKKVMANAGQGSREYTLEEYTVAFMRPVYEVCLLLYRSKDPKERAMAQELPDIAKRLIRDTFDGLHELQKQVVG